MSSLIRRMQQAHTRKAGGAGRFHEVGTALGIKNPKAADKLAREAREKRHAQSTVQS